ncbi:nitroreductase [Clostridium sp. HBUAS56010]|uniref:nitroreductase family protein n=1 Tax=Clostridium sp. HBUAS56010 TaxID=2571127 RepID=UPI001178C155|nr:nitroreductase [Clostridium sp. HBUAS56010]
MNEVIQNILTRRSVRTYQEKQISGEDLNAILEAAKFAPSGMGKQCWHFTAIQNKEVIDKLVLTVKEALKKSEIEQLKKMADNPAFNPFYNAPTIVLTAYDRNAQTGMEDCAAALQNMFLAAHSLNIGSCWIQILAITCNDPEVRSLLTELGIPKDYDLCGTAALGYNSKEAPKAAPRKEGIVTIIK